MKRKKLRKISLIFTGIYVALCILELLAGFCLKNVDPRNSVTVITAAVTLFINPSFLFVFFLNILGFPEKEESMKKKMAWTIWIILYPIFIFSSWLVTFYFVAETTGVIYVTATEHGFFLI